MANTDVNIQRYILIFDDLYEKIQKLEDNEKNDIILKALATINDIPNVMLLNLVDHKLFIEIRSKVIDLLDRWCMNGLNEHEADILDSLIEELALEYRCAKRDIRNEDIYNKLLFYSPLLNVIKINIDNISLKPSNDQVLDIFNTLVHRLIYLSDVFDDDDKSNMLKPIFDSIIKLVTKSDSSEKDNFILTYYIRFITFDGYLEKSIIDHDVIDTIIQVPTEVLSSTCLNGHKLFPKIISILTDLFDKWLTLSEHDKVICSKLINIFQRTYHGCLSGGLNMILNRSTLINTIKICLENSLKIKTYDNQYYSNLTKLITKLTVTDSRERDCLETILKPLDQLLLAHITSINYKNSFEHIQNDSNIYNDKDEFFLFTCINYISSAKEDINNELFDRMSKYYEYMLKELIFISNEFENKSIRSSFMYIILILNRLYTTKQFLNVLDDLILLFNKMPDGFLLEDNSEENQNYEIGLSWQDDFPKNLDSLNETSIPARFIYSILSKIYACVRDSNIISVIKDKHIAETILRLTTVNSQSIQRLAYNILALVMSENDVRKLAQPDKITSVFIEFLKETHEKQSYLYDDYRTQLIDTLKAFLQHDQIKEEFIKQDGLSLIMKFLYNRDKYDRSYSETNQSDALELICILAFDDHVAQILKQNQLFMTTVKSILTIESDKCEYDQEVAEKNVERIKKAANSVLWVLENEEKTMKNNNNNEQRNKDAYDLMISYSWNDMDLAHKISDYLTANKHYNVWIDRDKMHGSIIDSMASAIESSNTILMCMSETYKRSENCKAEAEYARKRKRRIIPLMMREKYDPDGWLGFICGQKLYIDFTKSEFETAMSKLTAEIEKNRQDKQQLSSSTTPISIQHETEPKATPSMMIVQEETKLTTQHKTIEQSINISNYFNNIEQWSEQD
ncbi:unnamed protein product, partial [Rotaria sordida]